MVAFDESARGRLPTAIAAASLAFLALGLVAIASPKLRSGPLAHLLLAFFWLLAALQLATACARGESTPPALLFLAVAAFAGLRPGPAWAWSGLAVLTLAAGPPLTARLAAESAAGSLLPRGQAPVLVALGILAVALAATLRRASSAARDQRAEAEAADERSEGARSRQIANVSHELRTPLNGIVGLLELVLRSDLAPGDRRQLEWAHNSAEFMQSLIDDLLDLDRLAAGGLTLRSRSFDLSELVMGVEQLLGPRAAAKGLALSTRVSEEVPPFLIGDVRRLRQVLLNLVGNAVKFTRRGAVTLLLTRGGGDPDRPSIRFEVRDTGPGIPTAQAEHLFERHARGDATSDRLFPSSGLGLSISRELVGAMGGRIGASSELGQGSVFWFEVPLGRGTRDLSETPTQPLRLPRALAAPMRSAADLRVLVVEDDPVSRELALGQLRALDLDCEAVERGDEALELLGRRRFDAVLMDVEMPGIDGLETTRRLRRQEGGQGRRVVFGLTARALGEQQAECIAAGMDDCMAKPVQLKTLRQAFEYWLNCSLHGLGTEPVAGTAPPARVGGPSSRLDEDRLADLESLARRLDQPILASLIESFRGRSARLLAEIAEALEAADRERIRVAAHTLAGSAANLGATFVARSAKAIEKVAESGALDDAGALLAGARDETAAALGELGLRYAGRTIPNPPSEPGPNVRPGG